MTDSFPATGEKKKILFEILIILSNLFVFVDLNFKSLSFPKIEKI